MKYRKKPLIIEAFCFRYDNCPDWFIDKVTTNEIITYQSSCVIQTLEGNMTAMKGDYIIKGIHGEIYPCKPKIFLEIYEAVL